MAIPSAVQIARDLVRMETINPPGNERECTDYLGALLEDAGFAVACHDYAERRTSLVAVLLGNGGRAPICFGGHVDVVPLGDAPWSVPPFAAEIGDGKLYGRGSSDMKGGVAASIHAGLVLAGERRGAADIVLVVVAGEETGCDGSKYLAGIGALPKAGAIVIAEPTSNYPYLGHRGALWLEGIARGKTAHGSMPELGDNAIYKAARAVAKLEGFAFDGRPDALLGATTLNVGTFAGGININSVPDLARFTVDIRTIPGHDHGEILRILGTLLGDEIALNPVVDVGPVLTSASDPWVREIYEHMHKLRGETPEPRGAPYFTDASALTPACGSPPTLILGPGEMAQAHQTDEFCHVDRIEEAAEIYAAIARRWGGLMQ